MPQEYSNPKGAATYGFRDIEVFAIVNQDDLRFFAECVDLEEGAALEPGWYWWVRLPYCLPDSEAFGPFSTEEEATFDALNGIEDEDEFISLFHMTPAEAMSWCFSFWLKSDSLTRMPRRLGFARHAFVLQYLSGPSSNARRRYLQRRA